MTKVTLKKLNTYLQVRVPRLELVKGEGYFYFAEAQEAAPTVNAHPAYLPESIYLYALNRISLERWHEMLDEAVEEYHYNTNGPRAIARGVVKRT